MFSVGRNLWFRAVDHTLPTSQRLHDLIPEFRITNICQLCHITIDSSSHFLVSCPLRWAVWTRTWGPIFYCEPDEHNLLRVIMDLRWDLIPPNSFVKYTNVIQGTLLAIWRSHWNLIFNNRPFDPLQVSRSALKIIHSLQAPSDD
ncbi:hypothetical protein INT45_002880 [Circinella minor]|uniref:Reverse transcriptase zinc-binding domain-containing protein n=1 Tax=Circinella minor TaxID=1195481 RepID=A0A8H7VK04_9FUNG|nr:hypothetical protein INT45_002880 [Circinella minor]